MYATAALWFPQRATGKFLKRRKPLPLRSSVRMECRKGARWGRGKDACFFWES
jgi:hypothetical protein